MPRQSSKLTDERAKAVALVRQGATLPEVATALGVRLDAAQRRVEEGLNQLPSLTPDQARLSVEARIAMVQGAMAQIVSSPDTTPDERTRAALALLKAEHQLVQLWGLAVKPGREG